MGKSHRETALKLTFGVILSGVFIELLSRFTVLPGAGATARGLESMWREGSLQHNIEVSSARWLIGWSMGAFAGVVIGFLTGRLRVMQIGFEGFLIILRAIPFICLVPISLLIFGLGEEGKFFLVGWASASVAWVVVHDGVRSISPELRWRALSLGSSRFRWIFRVLLPASSEKVFSALRASLSIGLIVVAVAEMSGVYERSSGYWWSEGLGYRMFRSLDEARNDLLMASVVSFAVLGIGGDLLFQSIWRVVATLWFRRRQQWVQGAVRSVETGVPVEFTWGQASKVRIDDLSAGYGEKVVIDGLNLTIAPGDTVSIVGPSGCGKTTLVRAIARFRDEDFRMSDGIVLNGERITSIGPRVGVVMQEAPVFGHMTVWDNVCFGSWKDGLSSLEMKRIALYLLKEFGIEEFASSKASNLSGGQRQRVALATTVANRPELLLLDEPFGALDAITRRRMQSFYDRKISHKVSAVFVTHDVEEALIVGDRVRIGIDGPAACEVDVEKDGSPPHVWELGEGFARQRARILGELERLTNDNEHRGGLAASAGGFDSEGAQGAEI